MTGTITAEEIVGTEIVLLELTSNLPSDIRNHPDWKPFMRRGWKTWSDRDCFESALEDGILLIEDNFYGINFPSSLFKEID